MKSKDIPIIVGVAIVAAIISYLIAGFAFGGKETENLSAPIIQPISSEFAEPDQAFFNNNSINPTKDIEIGENNNSTPF